MKHRDDIVLVSSRKWIVMGIGNKKILSEVRKVRQVSSFRNSLLRFPARGKSQPIRYLGLFRLLCVSGAFSLAPKRTLNLHLAYFSETLYSASPQTNKKALILLRIRAFSNFAFLRSGAYGTWTRRCPQFDFQIVTTTVYLFCNEYVTNI